MLVLQIKRNNYVVFKFKVINLVYVVEAFYIRTGSYQGRVTEFMTVPL